VGRLGNQHPCQRDRFGPHSTEARRTTDLPNPPQTLTRL